MAGCRVQADERLSRIQKQLVNSATFLFAIILVSTSARASPEGCFVSQYYSRAFPGLAAKNAAAAVLGTFPSPGTVHRAQEACDALLECVGFEYQLDEEGGPGSALLFSRLRPPEQWGMLTGSKSSSCTYLKPQHMPTAALPHWLQQGSPSAWEAAGTMEEWEVPSSCEARLPGFVFLPGAADESSDTSHLQLGLYSTDSAGDRDRPTVLNSLSENCAQDEACAAFSSRGRLLYSLPAQIARMSWQAWAAEGACTGLYVKATAPQLLSGCPEIQGFAFYPGFISPGGTLVMAPTLAQGTSSDAGIHAHAEACRANRSCVGFTPAGELKAQLQPYAMWQQQGSDSAKSSSSSSSRSAVAWPSPGPGCSTGTYVKLEATEVGTVGGQASAFVGTSALSWAAVQAASDELSRGPLQGPPLHLPASFSRTNNLLRVGLAGEARAGNPQDAEQELNLQQSKQRLAISLRWNYTWPGSGVVLQREMLLSPSWASLAGPFNQTFVLRNVSFQPGSKLQVWVQGRGADSPLTQLEVQLQLEWVASQETRAPGEMAGLRSKGHGLARSEVFGAGIGVGVGASLLLAGLTAAVLLWAARRRHARHHEVQLPEVMQQKGAPVGDADEGQQQSSPGQMHASPPLPMPASPASGALQLDMQGLQGHGTSSVLGNSREQSMAGPTLGFSSTTFLLGQPSSSGSHEQPREQGSCREHQAHPTSGSLRGLPPWMATAALQAQGSRGSSSNNLRAHPPPRPTSPTLSALSNQPGGATTSNQALTPCSQVSGRLLGAERGDVARDLDLHAVLTARQSHAQLFDLQPARAPSGSAAFPFPSAPLPTRPSQQASPPLSTDLLLGAHSDAGSQRSPRAQGSFQQPSPKAGPGRLSLNLVLTTSGGGSTQESSTRVSGNGHRPASWQEQEAAGGERGRASPANAPAPAPPTMVKTRSSASLQFSSRLLGCASSTSPMEPAWDIPTADLATALAAAEAAESVELQPAAGAPSLSLTLAPASGAAPKATDPLPMTFLGTNRGPIGIIPEHPGYAGAEGHEQPPSSEKVADSPSPTPAAAGITPARLLRIVSKMEERPSIGELLDVRLRSMQAAHNVALAKQERSRQLAQARMLHALAERGPSTPPGLRRSCDLAPQAVKQPVTLRTFVKAAASAYHAASAAAQLPSSSPNHTTSSSAAAQPQSQPTVGPQLLPGQSGEPAGQARVHFLMGSQGQQIPKHPLLAAGAALERAASSSGPGSSAHASASAQQLAWAVRTASRDLSSSSQMPSVSWFRTTSKDLASASGHALSMGGLAHEDPLVTANTWMQSPNYDVLCLDNNGGEVLTRRLCLIKPHICLGKGAQGVVMVGLWDSCIPVAIKLFKDEGWKELLVSGGSGEGQQQVEGEAGPRQDVLSEVSILSQIYHPNVVRLHGFSLSGPRMLMVEELGLCSLDALLHQRKGPQASQPALSLQQVLLIACDVAAALAYLHPRTVHRDLKPGNILLDVHGRAKVSDFGLARIKQKHLSGSAFVTNNAHAGTVAYMAPELFDGWGQQPAAAKAPAAGTPSEAPADASAAPKEQSAVSEKIDIYALGVVVWEMLTGTKPWHQAPTHLAIILAVNQLGKRLPIPGPPRCPPALAALISACWAQDAQDRPSAADALQQLRGMLQDAWTTEGEGESA